MKLATILGVLAVLALPVSANADAPSTLSKQTLANNQCAFTRPALGPDGNFYLTLSECGSPNPLIAGVASLDNAGAIRWGPTYPADCNRNSGGHEGAGWSGVSVAEDGTVLATGDWNECRNGRLLAYEPVLGSILWQTGGCTSSPHPRQVPLIDDGNDSAIYGTRYLCSIDIATGSLNWVSGNTGQYIGGYGIVADNDGNISYGTIGSFLSEITSMTSAAAVRWRDSYSYTNADHQAVVAVTGNDDLLVQRLSPTSVLQLRNGSMGAVVWQAANLQYPVIGANGDLFAGTEVGNEVVALDLSGNELWRVTVGTASSTFVDFATAENNLYVRGGNNVSLLEGATGTILWTFTADANVSIPVALNDEGHPFFIDDIGQAYVLDTCSEYQTMSPWPVARHGNERHTGTAGAATSSVAMCVQNEPPTANAGADVSARAGDFVYLDGSASFDDNDPIEVLGAVWQIVAAPIGSAASLDDLSSFTPTLQTDLAGTYELELTVTDTEGLASEPNSVIISTDNLAPTSDAGIDLVVVQNSLVTLDGSASSDPENDPITFDWTLTGPSGSLAMLSDPTSVSPGVIADVVGNFEATLIVSDTIGPATPDIATITVISTTDYVGNLLAGATDAIRQLNRQDYTTRGHRRQLLRLIRRAGAQLQQGNVDRARNRIERAIRRVDGCAANGVPDGPGPGRDWIIDCDAQIGIFSDLSAARAILVGS